MADTIEIVQGTATVVEVAGPTGPQGPAGSNGAAGEAATVTVGTVTTGAAGSSASVTNTGTSSAAVLAFAIPRGDKGDKGDTGSTGPAGTTDYNNLTNKPNQDLDTSDNVTFNSLTASTEAAPGIFGGGDVSGGRIIATVRTDGSSDLPAQQIFESVGTTNKLTVTVPNSLAANRAVTYPDASGTLALTSDIPTTFAASAITSGTLDNARINWTAPSAIGNTTPNSGAFTTLSASTSLTLGTSGILSGGTNLIEQRNTTSAQTFRIYNTVSGTNDANYERGFIGWSSNTLRIGTEKAGTGSARNLEFYTDNTFRARFQAEGLVLSSSSSIVYFGSPYIAGSAESNFSLDLVPFGSGNVIVRSGLLKFHGTTSSFPAIKRSSTTLQVRLADDSAFAPLSCGALTLNGNLDASTKDIVTDTTTGTKIGTGTTQKLGFFNATPIVRPAAIADATDAATTQARLNDLLAAMRSLGLIAT